MILEVDFDVIGRDRIGPQDLRCLVFSHRKTRTTGPLPKPQRRAPLGPRRRARRRGRGRQGRRARRRAARGPAQGGVGRRGGGRGAAQPPLRPGSLSVLLPVDAAVRGAGAALLMRGFMGADGVCGCGGQREKGRWRARERAAEGRGAPSALRIQPPATQHNSKPTHLTACPTPSTNQ